jgi:TPR repeat protein
VCGVEQGENSFPSEETILQSLLADARNGKASAQWEIGKRYREGDGFPQSYEKAALWFRKAAEQGFAHAQNKIAPASRLGMGANGLPDVYLFRAKRYTAVA